MKRRHTILLAIGCVLLGSATTLMLVYPRAKCGRRAIPPFERTEGCCIRVNVVSRDTKVLYMLNARWLSWQAIQTNLAKVASMSTEQVIQLTANDKTTIQQLQSTKAAIEAIGLTNIEITVWQTETNAILDLWILPSKEEAREIIEEEPAK